MLEYFTQVTELTWIFVGLVTFLFLHLWYRRPNKFPPGPRGLPFVGAIPFFGKYPERKIKEWSKTYGPIMSVRVGSNDMVVLNDQESINQAFVKQHTKFSGRPQIPFLDQMTEGHGLIFVDYSEPWKAQRKFGLTALRGFGLGKRSMENTIVAEAAYVNEEIRSRNGKPFDMAVILNHAASNNICSVVMGRRFNYDDAKFKEVMHRVIRGFQDPIANAFSTVLMFAPFLMKVPPFSFYNQYLLNDVRYILKWIDEIMKEHEDTYDEGDKRDFIDAFIAEMKKNKDKNFTRLQLFHYVRDLFIAGTETTSSTLYWALLCLIHYPEVQEKLRKEIMDVVGPNGVVSMSHRPDMPYTCAFIEELYRYRTLVPLGVQHKTNEDAELNGYFIPKGTMVAPNVWGVHNDEKSWQEPDKFSPERFLDEKRQFVSSSNVMAFSVGPRHCLGEQLARMEIFIFLVGMVQKFEFLPDPKAEKLPDINGGSNGPAFVPLAYKLVAQEH